MNSTEIEKLIQDILKTTGSDLPRGESYLFDGFTRQLHWRTLSPPDRQKLRRKKMSQMQFSVKKAGISKSQNDIYFEHIVQLYDDIERLLEKLGRGQSVLEDRVAALLHIERAFIDEHELIHRLPHLDIHIVLELRKEVENSDSQLRDEILQLFDEFATMYRSWPNRPWKDV